jgi:hypothetical protein
VATRLQDSKSYIYLGSNPEDVRPSRYILFAHYKDSLDRMDRKEVIGLGRREYIPKPCKFV